MSLNKCNYDFHLLAEGWLSVPPYDDGRSEPATPTGSVATLRMVEYGTDDKPDIWYKTEIIAVQSEHPQTKMLIEKYGLPNAILVNCAAQQADLRSQLLAAAQ
jgi:hypothetical protein